MQVINNKHVLVYIVHVECVFQFNRNFYHVRSLNVHHIYVTNFKPSGWENKPATCMNQVFATINTRIGFINIAQMQHHARNANYFYTYNFMAITRMI